MNKSPKQLLIEIGSKEWRLVSNNHTELNWLHKNVEAFFEKTLSRILWSSCLKWNKKRPSFLCIDALFSLFLFLFQASTLTWLQISMHSITIWNGINQTKEYYDIYFSTSKDSCTCHPRVIWMHFQYIVHIRSFSLYKLWTTLYKLILVSFGWPLHILLQTTYCISNKHTYIWKHNQTHWFSDLFYYFS